MKPSQAKVRCLAPRIRTDFVGAVPRLRATCNEWVMSGLRFRFGPGIGFALSVVVRGADRAPRQG